MDTLLILRDTIATNVVKVIDCCSHCVQETETNWADVEIVRCIFVTIVLSVLIVSLCYGIKKWDERRQADREVWIALKKEYGKMVLAYIKEKGDDLKEKDSYLEHLDQYILQIDEHLKLFSSKDKNVQKEEKAEDNGCV